ncbi:hypothetical protein SV7mr_23000 [Stieleria bergensis]|uniref:Uncharacterized protein n=1 Tax=Stieleria bergensis TaxID=2528025 RepID=A0A517SUL8_9BACT|nr:hypothetical protein SV7mr_23000 [Planctomycetes bacterium SV_7m_r]
MKTKSALSVPDSLKGQLIAFRNRVWWIKGIETVSLILLTLGLMFLIVYAWERWTDAPAIIRAGFLVVALASFAAVPYFLVRWLAGFRGLHALARLLSGKLPSIGDRLLGVIELADNETEQQRSIALCQAAMDQVAADCADQDFRVATPDSRHRSFAVMATVVVLASVTVSLLYPQAAFNSLARLVSPWSDTPRYTFTRINPIDQEIVIAHGEQSELLVKLSNESLWLPETAKLSIANHDPLIAELDGNQYRFQIPPQLTATNVKLRIGDLAQRHDLNPMFRPELESVIADVRLPEYLQRPDALSVDSRAGRVTLVRGSSATVTAAANRALSLGRVNDEPTTPSGAELSAAPLTLDDSRTLKFQWRDQYGLTGKSPFELSIDSTDDNAPTVLVDGLRRQMVLLNSEVVKFTVGVSDDFGVKKAGIMWRGIPHPTVEKLANGEKILTAGGPKEMELDAKGTFCAERLGIQPQALELFVWAEDYMPGRKRSYSAPYTLYVLSPDQHAIWMTQQLSKWHQQALDVRDRERQLHEANKELRDKSREELATEESRRELARQADAEEANGRRLDRLNQLGEDLVKAAARNPEIGVGHLEDWAQMLQILKDLSDNRMPSVAELLEDSSNAPSQGSGKPSEADPQAVAGKSPAKPPAPNAGQVRANGSGKPSETEGEGPEPRAAPTLADVESSALAPKDDDDPAEPGPPKKPSNSALRLPGTTIIGNGKPEEQQQQQNQEDALDQAVTEQKDLLAEFDKIAEELNAILANLEGSTLVKRLKAESRVQNVIAGKLTDQIRPAFGQSKLEVNKKSKTILKQLSEAEGSRSLSVSYIMDDMEAYYQRRKFARFKTTLDEMREEEVLTAIHDLSSEIVSQQGVSVAMCEYWADTLDRWAENLVDPAKSGQCPGGASPESLPPSIVLEVLQILEGEIALRDETRVAEQGRPALREAEHMKEAESLSEVQNKLAKRIADVVDRIQELPEANKHFGKEMKLLAAVNGVMREAGEILYGGETGSPAIAAETEAIELLLQSKRINPNGGGGGGNSPGGGGEGNTVDAALALLGSGRNAKEVKEARDVSQTTGETGNVYPEEFRSGLDKYFNQLGG